MGGVIVIKSHAKAGEIFLMILRNTLNQGFGRDAFLLSPQHNGSAVGVVGANVVALLSTTFLKTHPNVGLDVLKKMTQMNGAVGIRERACHQNVARGSI